MEIRCISKKFRCRNCNQRFKKLVQFDQTVTVCENCNHEEAYEVLESEFDREEADRTYRIAFDHRNREFERQFHPRTDMLDRDPTNLYGDPLRRHRTLVGSREQERTASGARSQNIQQEQRQPTFQRRQQILLHPQQLLVPYTISPFNGSVRRHPFSNFFGDFFPEFFFTFSLI